MINTKPSTFLGIVFLFSVNTVVQSTDSIKPFVLDKLSILKGFQVKEPEFATMTDSTRIAYYPFIPKDSKAILIFFHGSGLYNNSLYQYFATQLANEGVGSILVDIRGHGLSQGVRGDSPTVKRVWNDVTEIVDLVHQKYPSMPIYLGGHSSGAGLILNYSQYKNHQNVDGYVFIAPYFGHNSGTNKEVSSDISFVKEVKIWKFIVNALSFGYLFGHSNAITFNFNKELLENNPALVQSYTATMMGALSPQDPQKLMQTITKRVLLVAAQEDEQLIAEAIINYFDKLPDSIKKDSSREVLLGAKHLDILLSVPATISSFVEKRISESA